MADTRKDAAAAARAALDAAFADVPPPDEMSDSKQLSDVEYDEVMSFDGRRWQEIGFDEIVDNADAVFWFSPAAFHYYLPGFLAAGLHADRRDSNAYDALIGMLDRSPEPDFWDDFFAPRWTLLTVDQIEAVRGWLDWFRAAEPDSFTPNGWARADDTLTLLRLVREEG